MKLRRRAYGLGAIVMNVALSACGGVGSGPVNSTPPPPTFNYTKIPDIKGTSSFQSASVGYFITGGPSPTQSAEKFGDRLKITYDAVASTYTVKIDGNEDSFSPFELDSVASTERIRMYRKTSTRFLAIMTPSAGGIDLSYTRVASWGSGGLTGDTRLGVFGASTQAGDMPRSGSANYGKIAIDGSVYSDNGRYTLETSSGSFTADFASGKVRTELDLKGRFIGLGPLGTGAVEPVVPLVSVSSGTSGTIASGDSGFSGTFTSGSGVEGTFAGSFFGPQAAEFGYAFELGGSTGDLGNIGIVGTMTGAK